MLCLAAMKASGPLVPHFELQRLAFDMGHALDSYTSDYHPHHADFYCSSSDQALFRTVATPSFLVSTFTGSASAFAGTVRLSLVFVQTLAHPKKETTPEITAQASDQRCWVLAGTASKRVGHCCAAWAGRKSSSWASRTSSPAQATSISDSAGTHCY